MLAAAATSNEPAAKIATALNPSCPGDVLVELVADIDLVRCAVAARAHTPPHIARMLARDPSAGVRWLLAANHQIDTDVLRVLTTDSDEQVAATAAWTLAARHLTVRRLDKRRDRGQ